MRTYLLTALCLMLVSCLPEDEKVSPFNRGDLTEFSLNLSTDYRSQAFFDLSSSSLTGEMLKTEWDLAFSSIEGEKHVFLNTGRLMKAAATGRTDFETIQSTDNLDFGWDDSKGNPESGVFYGWDNDPQQVYVLDMGYNPGGVPLGFKKIQFLSANDNAYEIRFANLDNSDEQQLSVTREENRTRVRVSLSNGGSILLSEPAIEDWDLLFSSYTETLFDGNDSIAYLVTGVLINPAGTEVSVDTTSFAALTATSLANRNWTQNRDAIGFDWKYFDFGAGSFLIVPNLNYLIKDIEGFYYKLRFTDFYDDSGNKGNPKFEFQRL